MDKHEAHIEMYDLIVKKLDGSISHDEEIMFIELMRDSENKKLFDDTSFIWNAAPLTETISFDTKAAYNKVESRFQKTINSKRSLMQWYAAAAVVVILLISSYFIFQFKDSQTDIPQLAEVVLDTTHVITNENAVLLDNSKVTLNQSSKITYAKGFGNSSREISLEGEAFFDIERDTTKPFIIHTEEITVKVLGTSFYVKANKGSSIFDVFVVSGTVWVASKAKDAKGVTLHAGDNIRYNSQTEEFIPVQVEENELYWNTKVLKFKREKLIDVAKTLEDHFNVSIFVNKDVEKLKLTAKFEHNSIEEVLQIIQATLDVQIQNDNNKIYVNAK